MKLKLHHINFCSDDMPALNAFYEDVLNLPEDTSNAIPAREMDRGFSADVAFKTDDAIQFHLTEKDEGLGERTGHDINPVAKGHIAFRTDDIEAFKQHLDAKGIAYSDYGTLATAEWHQIFFRDPDGNVIEVHQVLTDG